MKAEDIIRIDYIQGNINEPLESEPNNELSFW